VVAKTRASPRAMVDGVSADDPADRTGDAVAVDGKERGHADRTATRLPRRRARGTDVAIGYVECHGRPQTAALIEGIEVVPRQTIQELLDDTVHQITGVPPRETVPDEVVRSARQIELVDMTPEALRLRMAQGFIYEPDRVDVALGNYFRMGNLTALRELARLWLAYKVDEALRASRSATGAPRRPTP